MYHPHCTQNCCLFIRAWVIANLSWKEKPAFQGCFWSVLRDSSPHFSKLLSFLVGITIKCSHFLTVLLGWVYLAIAWLCGQKLNPSLSVREDFCLLHDLKHIIKPNSVIQDPVWVWWMSIYLGTQYLEMYRTQTLCISECSVTHATISVLNISLSALNPLFFHPLLLFFSNRSLVSPWQKTLSEKDFEVLSQ